MTMPPSVSSPNSLEPKEAAPAPPPTNTPPSRSPAAQTMSTLLDESTKVQLQLQAAYRSRMRDLYNFNATQMLEWPCLSCAWLPDRKNIDPDRDYSLQYIAVSTQAPPSAQNYINILEVAIPVEVDDDDGGVVESSANDTAAMQFRNVRGHSRIDQTILTDGQVLKLRSMPQNTDIIAVKLTNGFVCVYDLAVRLQAQERGQTVSMAPELKLRGHRKAGFGLDWHNTIPGVVASGSDDGLVMYWNIESQIRCIADNQSTDALKAGDRDVRPVHAYEGHKDVINDVSWHGTQEHLLASASGDCSVRLWDTRVHKSVLEYSQAHRISANALQFHPLATFQLATGGTDGIIKLWDIRRSDKEVHQLIYHSGAIVSLEWAVFSESVLASGGLDGRVVMWDLEKVHAPDNYNDDEVAPVELSFVHVGHLSRITDIAWCPSLDEEWMIASCDATNTLQYYRPRADVVQDYMPPDLFDYDNGDA